MSEIATYKFLPWLREGLIVLKEGEFKNGRI
jgi:hypothetical protein